MIFKNKKMVLIALLATTISAGAMPPAPVEPPQMAATATTQPVSIDYAFSPEAGAEALILKVINSAQRELRLAAYSFSSPTIAKALIAAQKRGVDVRVIVDDKRNRNKAAIAILGSLFNAGIPVRTNAAYALHHDKYLVADGRHVQNGSFNYTSGAAKANSENVLVIWNDPDLATAFVKHWASRWEQGSAFGAQQDASPSR